MLIGGIELGGTKIVCALGNENGEIIEKMIVPTQEPKETLDKCYDFFENKGIEALGIGSFGPVDLNKSSDTYGYITTTPKTAWINTDVVGAFKKLNVPIYFDTDVNAACVGEVVYGAGRNLDAVVYGTIGTGVGFGIFIEGKLLHGLMHPETGHMLINRHKDDKDYEGTCPYHSNCLESLACGPSIEKRWGKSARDLYDDEKVWDMEAYYIAQAVVNCVMCYSPERIILGGGVMHVPNLIEKVRQETLIQLNGYINKKEILENIDSYIVLPELGDNAGVIGSMALTRI